jgi:hypothetical protein
LKLLSFTNKVCICIPTGFIVSPMSISGGVMNSVGSVFNYFDD